MAGVPNGFAYEVRGGAVVIRPHGRLATTFRAAAADRFLTEVERGDPQLGARAEKCRAAERLSARGRS